MKQLILYLTLLLSIYSGLANAQNCYIRMDDASGMDTDPYQAALNTAACELRDVFPTEDIQNDFKVFSFGFYLHNENFLDGFPPVFDKAIAQAAQASPYYVLIGRQTDGTGIYTKFWVDIKLPESSEYPCADEEFIESLEATFVGELERVYNEYSRAPNEYYNAEIQALDLITFVVSHAYNCCEEGGNGFRSECTNECYTTDYNHITQSLFSKGYIRLENLTFNVENVPATQYANISTNREDVKFTYNFNSAVYDELDYSGENWFTENGDFLDELAAFTLSTEVSGTIEVLYFDDTNCNGIFTDDKIGKPVAETPNVYNYDERLIIIKLGNQPAIAFSRIYSLGRSLLGVNEEDRETLNNRAAVVIPALIAREIIKRAISAAVSVAINVMIEVAMEKYFAHGNECTWTEAWNTSTITMWDIFIWSWEGVLGNDIVSLGGQALLGAVSETLRYILNEENFDLNVALQTFAFGLATGVAVGLGIKYVSRAYDKFTLKYLSDNYDLPLESIGLKMNEFWNLLKWTFVDTKMLKAWEGFIVAPKIVRADEKVISNVKDLLERGFTQVDLDLSIDVIKKFRDSYSSISDANLKKFSEFLMEARKYSDDFISYGVNSDIFGQVQKALDSNRFKFPGADKASQYMKEMAAKMRPTDDFPNPGFLEQLNEAIRQLDNGGDIILEEGFVNGTKHSVDIIDKASQRATHFKAPLGDNTSTLTDNIKSSAKQFRNNLEPAPSGYSRISKVKLLSPSNPDFSKTTAQLKTRLQTYINTNGNNTQIIDDFHRLTKIQIVNQNGLHQFKVENTVVSIIQ